LPKVDIYTASKHGVCTLSLLFPFSKNMDNTLSPQLFAFHASLHTTLSDQNIHSAVICPHMMDTSLLNIVARLACAGARLTPVARVARAILHAASVGGGSESRGGESGSEETEREGEEGRNDERRGKGGGRSWSGGMYVLPDYGPVLWIARGESEEGVYTLVKERVERDTMYVNYFSCFIVYTFVGCG
jgi:hypothetical protein